MTNASQSRRLGVAGLALAAGLLPMRNARAAGGRLLVYVHVAVKQRAFQSALQSGLEGMTVSAVGRIGDFERGLADGQDAVLSLPIVLQSKGLGAKSQGTRGGAGDEAYSLVGVGAPPDPAAVKGVGALDILGRDGTTAFVHGLLGSTPKLERVTKVEDLLPLLQMDVVQAVVMPTRFLADLRATSRLELSQRELPKRVALPALASVGPAGDQVIAAVTKMPASALKALGVEAWR